MIKTKIKKAISIVSLTAIIAMNFGIDAFADLDIGDANVVWSPGLNADIIWDENFPGTASGTVNWIVVTAQVLPTLNMEISTWSIDLGTLTPWVESSWSLDIEVGTNAVAWVIITASSTNGWLENTTDNSIMINELTTDGSAESYTFESAAWTIDSTVTGFATSWNLTKKEVSDSSLETIYSTNKPELTDWTNADVTFTVGTTANAQTPAGSYTDSVTFVVTWTF